MSTFMSVFASLVEHLADLLQPLFHASAAAAAIVLFTALVRLLVHPLSRASARGQRPRAKLQPRIAELRKKHKKSPEKLQKAIMELHAEEKVSPLSGCLPSLLQLPAFFLLYHLFSNAQHRRRAQRPARPHPRSPRRSAGAARTRSRDGGLFGAPGVVYLVLFAIVATVASFNYARTKRQMAAQPMLPAAADGPQAPGAGAMASMTKIMPLMSFLTLFTVAVVPLAAALYVVTSTTWSAVERAVLYRDMPGAPRAALATAA